MHFDKIAGLAQEQQQGISINKNKTLDKED